MRGLFFVFLASSLGVSAASVATTGVPAAAYVQDGLLAHWDGLENAGALLHDDATNRWIDLSGNGHDLTIYHGQFKSNCFYCDGTGYNGVHGCAEASAALSLGGWKGETVSFRFDHADAAGGRYAPRWEQAPAGWEAKGGVMRGVRYLTQTHGTAYGFAPDRVEWNGATNLPPGGGCIAVGQLKIPADAKPGAYALRFGGRDVTLTVADRTLPPPKDWKTFVTSYWHHPWALARTSGTRLWSPAHFDAMRPFMAATAAIGLKTIMTTVCDLPWNHQCYDPNWTMVRHVRNGGNPLHEYGTGAWSFDYTVFDKWVEFNLATGNGPYIYCYSLCPWDYELWYHDESGRPWHFNAKPGTKAYEDYWTPFLVDFRRHLIEKGWFDKTYLASDERDPRDMKACLDLLRRVAPDFRVAASGNGDPATYKGFKLGVYNQILSRADDAFFARAHEMIAEGRKVMYYVCCFPPKPNTFVGSDPDDAFWLPVFAAAKGLSGFSRWTFDSFPADAMNDATYASWPSGDTFFMYPNGDPTWRYLNLLNGYQNGEKWRILASEGGARAAALAALAKRYDAKSAMAKKDGDFRALVADTLRALNGDAAAAPRVAPAAADRFTLVEDFAVADARGGAYGIVPAHDTALSHRHGWIEDGVYRIPVDGNRHVLATPPLRDFRLETDFTLVRFKRLDLTLGFKVMFRHDLASRRGHELAVFYDRFRKRHVALDGRDLSVKPVAEPLPLVGKLVLDVKGDRGTAEVFGETVAFDLKDATERVPSAGKIALDLTLNEGVKLLLKKISLVSSDALPTTPVGRWRIQLPQSQGFVAPAVYEIAADRYATGEVRVEAALAGMLPGRPDRFETGGGEWSSMIERLTSPYVAFRGADGREARVYLWNGRRAFRDAKGKRKRPLPCPWPCRRAVVLPSLSTDFLVAAGYEKAMVNPWRFVANGPYEKVVTAGGETVHVGEALGKGRVAFAAASPAEKAIAKRIPADHPERARALKHAREQHYFLESEMPRFTLTAVFRAADFDAAEIAFAPRLETVFGDATDIAVTEERDGAPAVANLPGGYVRVTRNYRLAKNPGVGVWHLMTRFGAAPSLREERTIFEVLSDDPNGPCPPLASGLPVLFSMPNEIKYLEESAFDPVGDLGGVSHYYAIDMRYPAIGERMRIWELDHAYARKYFTQSIRRNTGDYDQTNAVNRVYQQHADYYGGYPIGKHREGRFDFALGRCYVGEQRRILEDWQKLRGVTLKSLPAGEFATHPTDAVGICWDKGINESVVEEIWNLGRWNDFKTYAKGRVDAYMKDFVDYLLSVNPRLARASYGPMPIYTAVFKTPYTLEYDGHPVEDDPRLKANGSFWVFEDYHYSCDYPLYRPAFFAAGYALLHPQGRRLFPEIYYEGWGRCADGAVYQAHPDKYPKLSFSHQRRLVYQYAYGTPYFRDGAFGYWNDYGFHARNPEEGAMDEFVKAWGNLVKNKPKRPLRAPFVIVDPDAFRRFGDRFERFAAYDLRAPGFTDTRSDVVNLAEESVSYAYERCVAAGYATPVVATLAALDALTPENCAFAILPPLAKGTPASVLDAVRRAKARGVKLMGFIAACGLEGLFDAFAKEPPTLKGRDRFYARYARGREALDEQTAAETVAAFARLDPAPAVKAERGTVMACETEKGDYVVILSDDSPLYGDTDEYPQSFRFTVSAPGIGARKIEADAPYAVVSRGADRVTIRTATPKDAALFFRFAARCGRAR